MAHGDRGNVSVCGDARGGTGSKVRPVAHAATVSREAPWKAPLGPVQYPRLRDITKSPVIPAASKSSVPGSGIAVN